MKKSFRVILSLLLTFSLFIPYDVTAKASSQEKMGPFLQEQLVTAHDTDVLEVIVTFEGEGAPTAQQLDLLQQLGIVSGTSMQSLPMAGVLATP